MVEDGTASHPSSTKQLNKRDVVVFLTLFFDGELLLCV